MEKARTLLLPTEGERRKVVGGVYFLVIVYLKKCGFYLNNGLNMLQK